MQSVKYYYLKYETMKNANKILTSIFSQTARNNSVLKTLMHFVVDLFKMLASVHPVFKYHFVHSDDDSNQNI